MAPLKMLIRKAAHRLGYDIRPAPRRNDAALYRELYSDDAVDHRRFYNVGAGSFRHPCWTNVDHESDWYRGVQGQIGISWDLLALRPLPVAEASAEIVYTSHTIEHVTDPAAENLFAEAHRILKPGGILRVTGPNVDLDHRAYRANDRRHFYWIDQYSSLRECQRIKLRAPMSTASIQQIFLYHFASSVSLLHADGARERIGDEELDRLFDELAYEDALNHCTAKCSLEVQRRYPGNHINWWNPQKVVRKLKAAGFAKIDVSSYGQSAAAVLRNTDLFDATHPKISFYVEATR